VHVADLRRPSSSSRALPRRFQDRREAGSTPLLAERCLAFTRATETTTTPRLAARCRDNRDAFRRVVIDRVAPAADSTSAFLFECAAQFRAPFSPRSRRLVCQHVGAESSSASAVSPTCLAAPRASRRAMRQTDFCLLTFFVRAPAPRRFPMRHALARRAIEGIAWFMSVRLASVGRTLSWCHRGGRCLPVAMRAVRTSGIPVASPTAVMSLARRAHP